MSRRFRYAEAVAHLARTRRAVAPPIVFEPSPDPLAPADRAALAEDARAAGRPLRAQLIQLGVLTPRQAFGEMDEADEAAPAVEEEQQP